MQKKYLSLTVLEETWTRINQLKKPHQTWDQLINEILDEKDEKCQ